ncbi:MAG: ImmA/IrrE family metallo-endopeptidase, partial [Candidatus Kapaibacterium sp.]
GIAPHAMYAMIVAHEFGHAMFDHHGKNNHYASSEFCRVMEEAYANLFARMFLLSASDAGVLDSREVALLVRFMYSQKPEYAFGVRLFDQIGGEKPFTLDNMRSWLQEWRLRVHPICMDSAKAGERDEFVRFAEAHAKACPVAMKTTNLAATDIQSALVSIQAAQSVPFDHDCYADIIGRLHASV